MRKLSLPLAGLALIAGLAHRAPPGPPELEVTRPDSSHAQVPMRTRTASMEEEATASIASAEGDPDRPVLDQDPRFPDLTDDSDEAWEERHRVLHQDALAELMSNLETAGHDPARFQEVIEAASAERWSEASD